MCEAVSNYNFQIGGGFEVTCWEAPPDVETVWAVKVVVVFCSAETKETSLVVIVGV